MKFFIADPHFCHANVIKMNNRPFANVEEMNQTMIHNWNKAVLKNTDEIYILGDFLYRGTGSEANRILQKLKGRKFLIRGNHENYLNDKDFDSSTFEWIKDYYTFRENKRKIILFHYPILEWESYFSNSIHLFGHVHNTRSQYFESILGPRAFNVGAEMIDYTPISMQQIFEIVESKENLEDK